MLFIFFEVKTVKIIMSISASLAYYILLAGSVAVFFNEPVGYKMIGASLSVIVGTKYFTDALIPGS